MKNITLVLLGLIIALTACGDGNNNNNNNGFTFTSSTSPPADGVWSATLISTATNTQAMAFTMSINMGGLNNESISGVVQFTQIQNCFGPSPVVNGTTGRNEAGVNTVDMTIRGLDPTGSAENQLNLVGTIDDAMTVLTGTWTLQGVTAGCPNDAGTFTMTRVPE